MAMSLKQSQRADRLAETSNLRRLIDQAKALARLEQQVKSRLPAQAAPHVRVANLRDGVLVLQAGSSAWRTRIHYQAPQLLETLRAIPALKALVAIQVHTAPVSERAAPAKTRHARLSTEAAHCLDAAAATIADPALSAALHRLAARAGKPPIPPE